MRLRTGRRHAGPVVAVAMLGAFLSACVPPNPPPPGPTFDWSMEDVDGPGVGTPGATSSRVWQSNAPVIDGSGTVHNFYVAEPGGFSGQLRHAWNAGSGWQFEDLDGTGVSGGNGRTDNQIRRVFEALVIGSSVHVVYQDGAAHRVRHTWNDGTGWQFEDVASYSTDDPSLGAVAYAGELHLFYGRDPELTPQELYLHHAWRTASGWQFEDLDGPGVPGANGRVSENVGNSTSAAVDGNIIHVVYGGCSCNQVGAIRHAVFNGSTWSFEVAEQNGDITPGPALVFNGEVHYFMPYLNLVAHRWRDGAGWHHEVISFGPGSNGCQDTSPHEFVSPIGAVWNGSLHAWYRSNSRGLCHAVRIGSGNWDEHPIDGLEAPPGNGAIAELDMVAPAVVIGGDGAHVFYGNGDFSSFRLRYAVGQQN